MYYFRYEVDLYLCFHTEVLLAPIATDEENEMIEDLRKKLKESAGNIDTGDVTILGILEFINEKLTKLMESLKVK